MSKAFVDAVENDIIRISALWTSEPSFQIEGILIGLPGESAKKPEACLRKSSKESLEALRALQAVLKGEGDGADLEKLLRPGGCNSFSIKVLRTLLKSVPRGRVISYGRLASLCGSPGAARAVGGAMASNPFPILYPCHRVLGSDGSLTGFGGGLELKRRMLEMEGVEVAKGKVDLRLYHI